MLLTRLHQKALRRVQMISTVRSQDQLVDAPILSSSSHGRSSSSSLSSAVAPMTMEEETNHNTTTGRRTRIVCMSDTHGKHRDIPFLPPGDVLIHAGDFTKMGEPDVVRDLGQYFHQQQQRTGGFQEVLCIAGNHDITFDEEYYQNTWSRRIHSFDPLATRESLATNCTYLEDSSATLLDGKVNAYGSPWTPHFWNWAFNLQRGEAMREVWSRIPDSVDVLVTHGPPHGRHDLTLHSGNFGCLHLLREIQQRIKPRLHIFGHIHEGYGYSYDGHTLFVNASNLDLGYEAINPCFVIDLPHDKSQPAMIVQPRQWIHDAIDLMVWLKQNRYTLIADAIESAAPRNKLVLHPHQSLYSSATYQSICDQVRLRRRRHRPVRQELRTALCQLYSESFF